MVMAHLAAFALCVLALPLRSAEASIVPVQEPTEQELEIKGLADRLARLVAGRDPLARQIWIELSRRDPTHALLAEALPTLAKIPFASGTLIPTGQGVDGMLAGHLSVPTSKGLRILFEDEAEMQVDLDASGVLASIVAKEGKAIPTWAEVIIGIKWSAANPQIFKLKDVRKALGVRPPMNLYQDRPVYWLPDDHVAFGVEIWHCKTKKWCIDYSSGRSDWGDALYDPQPSRRCQSNLRTRIAPGNGSYAAAAFCRGGTFPRLFLIWMKSTTLEGRTIETIGTLEQQSPTIPFEFVPWGKERKPHLLVITASRVPSLLLLTSERAEEVAKGALIPDGLEIGAPAWCDINKDGLLEIVAPVTDGDGALSILVLLAEAKTDGASRR